MATTVLGACLLPHIAVQFVGCAACRAMLSIGSSDAVGARLAELPMPTAQAIGPICVHRCRHPELEAPAGGIRLPIARTKCGLSHAPKDNRAPEATHGRAQAWRARPWRGRDVGRSDYHSILFGAMGDESRPSSPRSCQPPASDAATSVRRLVTRLQRCYLGLHLRQSYPMMPSRKCVESHDGTVS